MCLRNTITFVSYITTDRMEGYNNTYSAENHRAMFDWLEYSVFALMLASTVLIGLYYGCFKKQNTTKEYMQGGKQMAVFPITMSLIASHISGVSLLGLPAEVYTYGTQFLASAVSVVLATVFILKVTLPVFYKLELTSCYQYLELRFSRGNRILASFMFTLTLVSTIPIVIYIPSLAFNQVTGVESNLMTPLVCIICVLYTAIGGLKAVVWTDTIQSTFTMTALIIVTVVGCWTQGIFEMIRINDEGHRLELFNLDPNPFARNTFWTVVFGFFFFWLGIVAFHPGALQRFIAVATYRDAQLVTIWSSFGFIAIKLISGVVGLLIYAKFYGCDPLASAAIKRSGQLVPYYVMSSAGKYPGVSGLFISGIVSAALGVMSAGLNTAALTLYEDFAYIFLRGRKQSETQAACIMKVIVFVLGCISVLLIFVMDKFDSIIQIMMSMLGTTYGAIGSMFMLGLFVPWANAKGAMIGGLTSLVFMIWIVIGAQLSIAQGKLQFPGKVTSVDNCPFNITQANVAARVQKYTGVGSPVIADDDVLLIYKISYGNYCMLGTIIGMVVGTVVSLLTKPQELKTLDPDLIAPCMHRFFAKRLQPKNSKRTESTSIHPRSVQLQVKKLHLTTTPD